ncbi:MAG: GT4 family glycosyltransferase PelF [Candidatus Bathyarchaeota archaeon]
MHVCIISENSYPVSRGGVSEWCSSLINGLPEVGFSVFTIAPDCTLKYPLPSNIQSVEIAELTQPRFKSRRKLGSEASRTLKTLSPLLRGEPLNCQKLFECTQEADYSAEELISSDENHELLIKVYEQSFKGEPFVPFYYSWVSLFYLLYKTIELYNELPFTDINHALNTGYAGLLGSLAKVDRGTPLLVSEHGLYLKERNFELKYSEVQPWLHDLYRNFFTGLVKTSYKYSDKVTSVCQDHVHYQKQIDPNVKIKVIYNGVDTDKFKFNDVAENREHYSVGTVSRVNPIKDQLTLIRSVPHVLQKHDAVFYVVGQVEDEEYYEECNQLVDELGLSGRVKFTGFQNSSEWYPRFDVFILPSLSEGFPLTILEALSSGVPCIATNVGGVSEILSKDYLVDKWDPRGLASKINWLLEDDDQRKITRYLGRRLVERRFSLDAMVSEYKRIYEGLC